MDFTNPLIKTAVDTLGTTGIITSTLPPGTIEQTGFVQSIQTGWQAPLIGLASSVIIQLVFEGLNWLKKKLSAKKAVPPLAQ